MGVTFHNWIATNENRSYPFDPAATRVTDDGQLVMTDWIADMTIRCGYSTEIYLGCVSITAELITMIFMGVDDTYDRPVLATTATLNQWLKGEPLFFRSMDNTVDGWIRPGRFRLPERVIQYRFSTPQQSKLAERCISRRQKREIGYLENYKTQQKLTGIVRLTTTDTGTLAATSINNKPAIEFGLTDDGLKTMANGINIVPETTAPEQAAIVQIAGAIPDCEGIIIIRFEGPFTVRAVSANDDDGEWFHAVAVGTNIELEDICDPVIKIPDITPPTPNVC
jgi:hypothetical protein